MPEPSTTPPVAAEPRAPAPRGSVNAPVDGPPMLDVLTRVFDHGVVVDGPDRDALRTLDIAGGGATVTVAAVDLTPTSGDGWDELVRVAEAVDDAARAVPEPRRPRELPGDLWRSGEHAALKRQFERLNA